MSTASAVMNQPQAPPKRWVAPSSCSTSASTCLSSSALSAASSAALAAGFPGSTMAALLDLDALLGEVAQRPRVIGDRREGQLLVLRRHVDRRLVGRHQ